MTRIILDDGDDNASEAQTKRAKEWRAHQDRRKALKRDRIRARKARRQAKLAGLAFNSRD